MYKQYVKHVVTSNKPSKITQPIPTTGPAPLNADHIKTGHYTRADIIQLQRLYGNQTVQRYLKAAPQIQRVEGDKDDPINLTKLTRFFVNSSGGSKKFYNYPGNKLIAVPSNPATVDNELKALAKIKEAGIQAVDAVKVFVGTVGNVQPAIKMSKLDGVFVDFKTDNTETVKKLIAKVLNGEKNVDKLQTEFGLAMLQKEKLPKLTDEGQNKKKQLLEDLQKILDKYDPDKAGKDGVVIYDLQGIVGPNGNFVVIDPLTTETIEEFMAAMKKGSGKEAGAQKAEKTYADMSFIMGELRTL